MSAALLSVRKLHISLRTGAAEMPLVRGISFDMGEGEILGLAGESGCGKSITALALMGLLPARNFMVKADRMQLGRHDLLAQTAGSWRKLRGSKVAMIFQDPATALDPVFSIGHQVMFAAGRAQGVERKDRRRSALAALESVGFNDPETIFRAYPHELSGGMRQLVMIAMAVAARPALILADEATTALDVTTQAHILKQFQQIRDRDGASVLMISHDLGVVAQSADRAMIMYGGMIMERATCRNLFSSPSHPYTAGLLAAIPRLSKSAGPLRAIPGQVPPPGMLVPGCPFAPRCGQADQQCRDAPPLLQTRGKAEIACFHPL